MAEVITAPNSTPFDVSHDRPAVFLAGGITGCADWQAEVIEDMADFDVTLLNPRRPDFDVDDPTAELQQITWEHKMLRRANAILFWFPPETLCPITLLEYGRWIGHVIDRNAENRIGFLKPLFVGTHIDYARRNDVIIQGQLERGNGFPIHASLAWTVDALKDYVETQW